MYASFNEISPLTSAEKAADIAAKRNRQKEDERTINMQPVKM